MSKCILFSRVSTEHQTLDAQTQCLKDEAIKLGYKEKDLILIEKKESAIKLDEDERIGLIMLQDAINKDKSIDCVICYEVSRIARKQKELFSIRDFLLDRQIQLIILKPEYLRLLKDDKEGELSDSASLLFSLLGHFSEIEMKTKKSRMMRNRRSKMQKGGYGGGWFAFGYKNVNDQIVIDEEAAKVVRKIYDMYEKGMSASTIAKHLIELGEIKQMNQSAAQQFVTKTIQREQYVGSGKGTNYIYPQIITQGQFDKCKAIRANKSKPRTGTSVLYYGHGIVFNELGNLLTPSKANNVYTSYDINTKHTASINLNMLDSIIWHITKEHIKHNTIPNIEAERKRVENKLEEVKKKIKSIERQIEEKNKRKERVIEMGENGIITIERVADRVSIINWEIGKLEVNKDELEMDRGHLFNEYAYVNSFIFEIDGANNDYIDKINDDVERMNLIRQTIKRIDAIKDESNMMGRYWLTFTFTNDKKERYKIRTTGLRKDLYDEQGNEIPFEMLHRVDSKKERKQNKV